MRVKGLRSLGLSVVAVFLAVGLVVVERPTPAAALDLPTAVGQASSYAAARGHQVGISVYDRDTGQVVENGLAHTQMRSASVLKVFVAESLLDRDRRGEIALSQADRDLMRLMVTRSDDAAMSSLYSRFGGVDMIVRVVGKYNLTEIGGPPTPSYWGMYQITAHDIAGFYRGVLSGGLLPADRDLLISLMRAATPTGTDGFDQYFGIPRALPYQYWGIKQGWMCCQEGMRRLHTTGILGQDSRFVVAILGQAPQSQSYAALAQTLTTVVTYLFPNGQIPPGGAGRVPFGSVDSVVPTTPGRFSASGWTADPDTPGTPIDVHAYLDGRLAAYGTASDARPDVAAALPGYGESHGYALSFAATDGRHELCVYAINVGPGNGNPSLGCRTVDVQIDPIGNYEEAVPVGLRGIQLTGWTLDPDALTTAVQLRIVVDGTPAGTVQADRARPDVAAAFPGVGEAHGFRTTVGMPWPGTHQVCVFAGNTAGSAGVERPLGCRTVVGPTGLLGQLDDVTVAPGSATLSGWLLDAVDVGDVVAFHVHADGQFAGSFLADTPRLDVAAVYREAGPDHGYSTTVALSPGPHRMCTYGIVADRRSPDPLLGCRSVVVP